MPHPLRRVLAPAAAVALVVPASLLAAAPAHASSDLCVGSGPGCYSSVQAAVDAAPAGSTIRIHPGTFRGEATVDKSLRLIGAGASRTRLDAGGHSRTLRILSPTTDRPVVLVRGLTVTGGFQRHDQDDFAAFGGGVIIDQVPGTGTPGATVTMDHVVVAGNRAEPSGLFPSPSGQPCPVGDCPFAISSGAGIANLGNLTLIDSVVRDNRAGGTASDAVGGGISSYFGTLTLIRSTVSGNVAAPRSIGRYAEGAGIFVESGRLTVRDSSVSRNTGLLDTRWPVFANDGSVINMSANSGGIHVGDGIDVSVDRSRIDDNLVKVVDPIGEPFAFDSAMLVGDSTLTMRHTEIRGNRAVALVDNSDLGPNGTTLEVDANATITDTAMVGNTAIGTATHGSSTMNNGLAVFHFFEEPQAVTLDRVRIDGNTAKAVAPHGPALVVGAGVINNSVLALTHSSVSGNRGVAIGATSTAQGGGIWNGTYFTGPGELELHGVRIQHNSVVADTAQGGGLFTLDPVVLDHVLISGNHPDQCAGAGCPAGTTATASASAAAKASATAKALRLQRGTTRRCRSRRSSAASAEPGGAHERRPPAGSGPSRSGRMPSWSSSPCTGPHPASFPRSAAPSASHSPSSTRTERPSCSR